MNSKFFSAKNVALLGILIALVIVLQLFASAIPMFGVTLNFSLIPIALAGIMIGWLGGLIVGLSSGLIVFITMAVMGGEPSTAYLFQASPVLLTLTCIGKTTLAGVASGLIYKLFSKTHFAVATSLSSLIIPVVNTGVYMLGIVLMKADVAEFLALSSSASGVVFGVVFGMIWLNFVLEMAINTVFTPVIYRVVKIFDKR